MIDYEDYDPAYCEACREDHSTDTGPELDRHDEIEWEDEHGWHRYGRVSSASATTLGGYWVIPNIPADHHEVEVLVAWHYASGFQHVRTYYDDHESGR